MFKRHFTFIESIFGIAFFALIFLFIYIPSHSVVSYVSNCFFEVELFRQSELIWYDFLRKEKFATHSVNWASFNKKVPVEVSLGKIEIFLGQNKKKIMNAKIVFTREIQSPKASSRMPWKRLIKCSLIFSDDQKVYTFERAVVFKKINREVQE